MLISLESVNVAFEIFNSCFSIHPTIPIPYGSNHPWFTHVKASHFHFLFILSVMRRISLLTCLLHRRWLTSILLYWQGGFPCNISYLQTRTEETACSFNLFSTTQKNRNAIRTFSLFFKKKKSFVLWFFSSFLFMNWFRSSICFWRGFIYVGISKLRGVGKNKDIQKIKQDHTSGGRAEGAKCWDAWIIGR